MKTNDYSSNLFMIEEEPISGFTKRTMPYSNMKHPNIDFRILENIVATRNIDKTVKKSISSRKEEPSGSLENKMVPLARLLKILKCEVCSEVVKIPFKSCQRGHLVCNKCNKNSPNNCPFCKAELSMDNPVRIINLLEALPRRCRHAGNGCKEMVGPERNDDHEKYCGFRFVGIAGGLLAGKQVTLVHDAISYFKSITHSQRAGNTVLHQLHEGATSSVSCGEFSKTNVYEVPISVYGMMFSLTVSRIIKNNELLVQFMFCALFIGKPVNDVFIRVIIERDDSTGSTYTLKAMLYGDKLISVARARTEIDEFIVDDTLSFDYEIFTKPL